MADAKTIKEIADTLRLAEKFSATGKLYTFEPYPKQKEFFDLGTTCSERMLRAGNQEGKTYAAAYETTCHMTGLYPKWWTGKRFFKPNRGWVCGEMATLVRDAPQSLLLGAPGSKETFGTGFVPRELILDTTASRSATDAIDTFKVRHVSGGVSSATFKSYEQGRTKFQSESLDWLWLDEEPDEEIYTECMTRTTATNGIIYLTYTPLKGMTALTRKFMKEKPPGVGEVHMTIYDAKHITPEMRAQKIASWPEHEREARSMGMPFLGSNAVFEDVTAKSLRVPLRLYNNVVHHAEIGEINTSHWTKLWAIDFGIGHNFAAVLLAWDRDPTIDTVYVLRCIRVKGGIPKTHAPLMKAIAAGVPVAWPHDGNDRSKDTGIVLAQQYKKEGLLMLPTHATFPDGGYSFEGGIREMLIRMRDDRFKVAEGNTEWFDEFHSYYRKDGLVVKEYDDLLSATRVGVMQIRSAKAVALGSKAPDKKPRNDGMCRDVDFDLS